MKIIVDINHPAHVHFFKNFIREAKNKGHEIIITASKKDITFQLLNEYRLPYYNIGSYGNNLFIKLLKIPVLNIRLLIRALIFKPDIFIGIASHRAAQVAWLLRKKSFIFDDTEHAKYEIALFKPFATKIFTPSCYMKNFGEKQIRYNGYHELAYLHPNSFKPNHEVLKEIGLTEKNFYFIIRFISWKASHDNRQKGFTNQGKLKLVNLLKKHGRVIITSEAPLTAELESYRITLSPIKMHDLLYYATMYIGEGGTMATESSVLGTPSIFVNSLNAGTFEELNKKYKLMFSFTDENEAFHKISELLENKNLKQEWHEKQKKLINDKINVTQFIIDNIL